MNKKYIFLTNNIGNIGGAQLYMSHKVDYLRSRGWEIHVFFYESNPVMIANLKEFASSGYVREMEFHFQYLPERQRRAGVKRMARRVMGGDVSARSENCEVIVESNNFNTSYWGEALAADLGGRHICYLLPEGHPALGPGELDFFRFKHSQRLLYAILPHCVEAFLPEVNGEECTLEAQGCSLLNVEDYPHPGLRDWPEADFSFLTVARFDKGYVKHIFRGVAEFAQAHPDASFNYVIVGDHPDINKRRGLLSIFTGVKNLKVIWLGFVFPLPAEAYRLCDMFIGNSGASRDAHLEGMPTVSVDANDFLPIGFFGRTTDATVFRRPEDPPLSYDQVIGEVFFRREEFRKAHDAALAAKPAPPLLDYSAHQRLIDMDAPSGYYDLSRLRPRSVSSKLYRGMVALTGLGPLGALKHLKRRMQKK